MKHIFIVNPVAGKRDATRALVPAIIEAAKRAGVAYETALTKRDVPTSDLARQFAAGGDAVRLYAVGGDGTLNSVLAGAYPFKNAEVASIPSGSGNDFVRSFGEVAEFQDLDAAIAGTAIPIDLMQVDNGICAGITSTGLDAEVAYNIPKYRRVPLLGGTMAYNISIVERLAHPLGKRLHIEMDGRVIEGNYLIATVCNGQTYGGGYRAAPIASLEDGVLEVVLVKKISRLLIASIIGGYKQGKHFDAGRLHGRYAKWMQHHRAKEVVVTPIGNEPFILNVDGECGPAPRLYAKVMPAAARFVLPASVCARRQKTAMTN